jgi:outer membrane protein assembly factor BamB
MTYRFLRHSLAVIITSALTAPLLAQELPDNPDAQSPNSANNTSLTTPAGISIPDSPGAADQLQKAKEKEDQHQWRTAADLYQDVLTKYARRVIPSKIDKTRGLYEYTGVARVVQQRMAKWPDDGLQAYRNAYGQPAADALTAAGNDIPALENVFWTYFISDAGKAAGLRLVDRYMEAGRFTAAAWIGNRLLSLHPNLGPDVAMLTYRTSLAEYWSGDTKAATAKLDDLKAKHANDTGSIAGKDVLLTDALASALQSPAPQATTRPSDADYWPSFGGPGGRGEVSPSTAKPGLNSINIPLIPPSLAGLQTAQRPIYQQKDDGDVAAGEALGIMPVADGGSLFFQDGRHLYAVSADSGMPLPGWLQTYGGEHGGRYSIETFGRPRGEQLTVSVTPTAVLAIMGQIDRGAPIVGQSISATSLRLVCLDRATGRELWSRSPSDLPDTAAALRNSEYNGTPLVIPNSNSTDDDASVLVVARGGKGNQFEDCYVVCLSLKGGLYKWSTYIGSASHIFDGDVGLEPIATSEISYADGRVFVLSNLGTVASLDPGDGRLLWLSSYPRDPNENPDMAVFRNRMNAGGMQRNGANKPWSHNPVVVAGGKVFVLPSDGKHLLVFDGDSGAELKRILLSDYDNPDVLLGAKDGKIAVTNDQQCFCIDWAAYDHDNPTAAIVWGSSKFDDKADGQENAIVGRGFLTADSVFIPTRLRLNQLSWSKGGRVTLRYPRNGTWSGGEQPGNVLVTSQAVIVAGSTRLDIYRDLALVVREKEQRIAANPDDPEPRVDFASALFTGGQPDAAMEKMDQAIALISSGPGGAMRPGKGRDLIFTTTLNFAERSAKDPLGESSSVATTEKLYDRAAVAAYTPLQNAMLRLSRARFDHARKDFAGEVQLCQEILSDDAMRGVMVSENATAGDEAAMAIGAAKTADRAAYTAIEQQAEAALAAARDSNDPAKLLAVATVYPNSRAAAEASQAAAAAQEAAGDHLAAIDTLRRMYTASNDFPVKSRLLESIARNFLADPAAGGVASAIDRLSQGGRDAMDRRLTQPLPLPDGNDLPPNTTFAQAVSELRKGQDSTDTARLPDFRIPIQTHARDKAFVSTEGAVIPGVTATTLVRPLRDFARNDRVIVWSPTGGLAVYPAGESTPVATVAAVDQEPRGAAWIDRKLLVVWTASRVTMLNDAGQLQWASDLQSPSQAPAETMAVASAKDAIVDDISGGPGDPSVIGQVNDGAIIVNGGGRIIIQGNHRLIIPFNGPARIIGPANVGLPGGVPAPARPPVVAAGEQIVAVHPAGDRSNIVLVTTTLGRLIALNTNDHRIVWQTRLSADGPIAQLLSNAHFTVARIDDAAAGAQLIVFDTPSGRVIGRRRFDTDGSPNQLWGVALSEEATLVWTTMNRLLVKDLYDQWKSPPVELTGRGGPMDQSNFTGMNQPDQLIVHSGRVIALYDGGKFVRVYDLSSAAPAAAAAAPAVVPVVDGLAAAAAIGGVPLATGADARNPGPVSLRLVGSRLFILNGRAMWQYSVDHANDHYNTQGYQFDRTPRIRDMLLGTDHAILLDDPIDRGPAGSSFVQLYIYRRGPISATNQREAGKLDYDPLIKDNAGILTWQAVDSGVYYLTGDQKLHFLEARR